MLSFERQPNTVCMVLPVPCLQHLTIIILSMRYLSICLSTNLTWRTTLDVQINLPCVFLFDPETRFTHMVGVTHTHILLIQLKHLFVKRIGDTLFQSCLQTITQLVVFQLPTSPSVFERLAGTTNAKQHTNRGPQQVCISLNSVLQNFNS